MSDEILPDVSDRDWERIVERSEKPVFVMFYSPTCGHCMKVMPSVEELAAMFSQTIQFARLNILQFTWLAERYGVMSTPTFLYFCGGKPVQMRVGAVFPAVLKKMIEEMEQHGEECRLLSTEISYEISGYG
jgi:thioredoxin-like negative regulator of GroEL